VALSVKKVERIARRVRTGQISGGKFADAHGLYLQVSKSKSHALSWLFRWTRNGRERIMGLGPVHTVSLDEARQKAKQQRVELLEGRDPIAVRDAKLKAAQTTAHHIPQRRRSVF
jgi:hypothetical protein